jgi:hypothetical protein
MLVFLGMMALVVWADGNFAGRITPAHQLVVVKACPVPGYMTNGTPDQDAEGIPTADGLLRRMYRMAPTCQGGVSGFR